MERWLDSRRAASARHGITPELLHQFDDDRSSRRTSTLGMWLFLVTEIMFFGGLFTAYIVYRATVSRRVRRARARHRT